MRETVAPGTFPTPSCPDPHASTVPAHSNAGPICVSSEAVAGAAVSLDPDVSPGPWGVWMAELALGLANSHRDLTATVDAIAWDGAQALPGADCGALVARQANGAPVCVSSTHSDALACVDLEARFSGPCSAVLRNESTIRIDELAAVLDWPEYRAQALAVGINSMLCVPLTTDGRLFGAAGFLRPGTVCLHRRDVAGCPAVRSACCGRACCRAGSCKSAGCGGQQGPDRTGQGHPDGTPQAHRQSGLRHAHQGFPEHEYAVAGHRRAAIDDGADTVCADQR